jgi:hypothetical protein
LPIGSPSAAELVIRPTGTSLSITAPVTLFRGAGRFITAPVYLLRSPSLPMTVQRLARACDRPPPKTCHQSPAIQQAPQPAVKRAAQQRKRGHFFLDSGARVCVLTYTKPCFRDLSCRRRMP